jgi:hypothetical protein
MHTVKGILVAAVLILCAIESQSQSPAPDDRFRLALTINGTAIEGSQERTIRLSTATTEQQKESILSEPLPQIAHNSSFQLVVNVTQPDGSVINMTGSSRLTYESWGCLTVSSSGFVSVVPLSTCKGAHLPMLWVVLHDHAENPITLNEYNFRVTSP